MTGVTTPTLQIRLVNRGLEKLGNLPKVTQLAKSGYKSLISKRMHPLPLFGKSLRKRAVVSLWNSLIEENYIKVEAVVMRRM